MTKNNILPNNNKDNNNHKITCVVSGLALPEDRISALEFLNIPRERWTLPEYSLEKPIKGIYLGEAGTSKMLLVNSVGEKDGVEFGDLKKADEEEGPE